MTNYEQVPYYDCDDEGESMEYYEPDYYQNKLMDRHQMNEQIMYQNDNQMYSKPYHPNQPNLVTDEENIMSSCSDDQILRVPLSNKVNDNYRHLQEGYFEKPDIMYSNTNREQVPVNNFEQNELLTITVEVGNGEKENIVIMENDTPELVADRFCKKYQLNDELREIFVEQIAQNIEQVKQEISSEKQSFDGDYRQAQVSTAIDNNTPPPKGNIQPYHNPNSFRGMIASPNDPVSNYENFYNSQNITSNDQHSMLNSVFSGQEKPPTHSYQSPGPILINPNKDDKRTLTNKSGFKQYRNSAKPKGTKNSQSYSNFTANKQHVPRINSHSNMLANKKKAYQDNIHERLHAEAARKLKNSMYKLRENDESFEASSIMNRSAKTGSHSFRNRSATRPKPTLVQSTKTYRDSTPSNVGERLYQNGLRKLEEKNRKNHKEKMAKELSEVENLTFKPKINNISRYFGREDGKKLEDHLLERGKKTKDNLEKKRSELLYEKQNSHSFRPKINKHSERMIMERSRQYLEESAAVFSNSHDSNQIPSNTS
jgi:hypothetical protein